MEGSFVLSHALVEHLLVERHFCPASLYQEPLPMVFLQHPRIASAIRDPDLNRGML